MSQWSLEDLLEVGGACVWGRGGWNVYCEETDVWELWTREYVDGGYVWVFWGVFVLFFLVLSLPRSFD